MSQSVHQGYELQDKIGGGAMGDVYRAYQPSLNRFVAIKVIKQHLADDPAFMERFFGEARLSASLNHPNIAHIYEVGEHAGRPYMVMELLEGEPLEKAIERGPLGEVAAVTVAKQVLAGLSRAYERGTVAHRDIKPGNIFLCTDGTVKVMDFGIAKAAEASQLTQVGTVLGTAAYMSPEQSDGLPVDARSDLYSLGVVLYEMLTGRLPFDADTAQAFARLHRSAAPPPLPGTVSPDLRAVVGRALAKDPAQRFGSAGEMLAALDGRPPKMGGTAPALGGQRPELKDPLGWSEGGGGVISGPSGDHEEALGGWNWGAYGLNFIWLFSHKLWPAAVGFLLGSWGVAFLFKGLSPVVQMLILAALPIYLGLHGNRLAWKSGRFATLQDFKACENVWAKWGITFFILNALTVGAVGFSQIKTSNGTGGTNPPPPPPPPVTSQAAPLVAAAYQLLVRDKLAEAVAKAREAVAADDNSGDAHAILSIGLLEQNWSQGSVAAEAQQEDEKALKLNPNSALAHAAAGDIKVLNSDNAGAVSELQSASGFDSGGQYAGYIHNALAVASTNPVDEENEARKSLAADPEIAWANFNLGHACYKQGKFSDAVTSLQAAIQEYPQSSSLGDEYVRLGAAQFHLNQFADATKSFGAAVEKAPSPVTYAYLSCDLSALKALAQRASDTDRATRCDQLWEEYHQAALKSGITDEQLQSALSKVAIPDLNGSGSSAP